MNERIKELIIETLGKQGVIDSRAFGHWALSDEQLEKFAELIVAECVEQVWYTREDGINGNVSLVIKERMKQHFGVEE